MAPTFASNPFAEPAFLEGLEAAGYLQRLDTSEARITARYQHALTKMHFASHSEEFLTRAGVRKVHGSTVQFFNETPVSDPFVHVLVGKLPKRRQALITPAGCSTTGWTPIDSPDEAEGTVHFTVSHAGFWPLTVVFDSNPTPEMIRAEDKFAEITDDSEEEDDLPPRRTPRRGDTGRSTRSYDRRGSIYDDTDDAEYSLGERRTSKRGSARRNSRAYEDDDEDDATVARRERSLSRRNSSRRDSTYSRY